MGGTGFVGVRRLVVLAFLAIGSMAGIASAGPRPVDAVLRSLELRSGGVDRWLAELGVTKDGTGDERLMIVTTRGQIVATLVGEGSRVDIGPDLVIRLSEPGAGLVLVHNHPLSTSLSWVDVVHLARPGVAAVVAIGHDGSVYAVAPGPRFDPALVTYGVIATARAAAEARAIRYARAKGAADCDDKVRSYFPHVVLEALASTGVVDYRTRMAPDRLAGYRTRRALFEDLTMVAATRVEAVRSGRAP